MSRSKKVYVQLGRTGDLLSLLPFFWRENQLGRRCLVCIHPDYVPLMDGLSYVDYCIWNGPINEPLQAMRWLKGKGFDVVVSQFENNPQDDRRLTPNYQRESWRLAGGKEEDYRRWPLVIDNFNESDAVLNIMHGHDRPVILVALDGISSPYPPHLRTELFELLKKTFEDSATLIDMSSIRATSPANLVRVIERASLLVSIDTMFLHLARACSVPVMAILNPSYFLASDPPPTAIAAVDYDAPVGMIVDTIVERFADPVTWHKRGIASVFHVVHQHGETERHKRAAKSWYDLYETTSLCDCLGTLEDLPRTAKNIGDPRPLPYLKDVLAYGLKESDEHGDDKDVLLWTNDDVTLKDGIVEWAEKAAVFGAMSMRRDPKHLGRDCFAFSKAWLRQHWDAIPDYIMGCSDFDMGLVAFIRQKRGIPTCLENMAIDFYPCEWPPGDYTHEDHPSEWHYPGYEKAPSIIHNRRLFRDWAAANQPTMQFTPEGVLK